jgi:hypothetical protein
VIRTAVPLLGRLLMEEEGPPIGELLHSTGIADYHRQ